MYGDNWDLVKSFLSSRLRELPDPELVRGARRVSDQEAYDGLRVERGRWRLGDEEARESYAKFLRQEIGRIDGGGAHPPWLTRVQSIEVLERELANLDRQAP